MLQYRCLILIITLEQRKEIVFCKTPRHTQHFRCIFGTPLELTGSILFLNICTDNRNTIQLKTISDYLHQQFNRQGKTAHFLKNLKGSGDYIVMKIPDINIAIRRRPILRQFKPLQAVAEHIAVPAVFLGPVQRPVRIFKQMVISISGNIFPQETNAYAAGDRISFILKRKPPRGLTSSIAFLTAWYDRYLLKIPQIHPRLRA